VGPFTLDEARPLPEIEAEPEQALLAPVEAVRHLERVDVDAETAAGVAHGLVFPAGRLLPDGATGVPVAVVGPAGDLLALYERSRAAARPLVVFN
jgi:hypothetical protein